MSTEAYVEATGLAYLDGLVGSYLRGDTIVYKGTLSAHDNQSVLGDDCNGGSACQNGSIPEGPAVASLDLANGATLTVHSLAAHAYVVLQQASDAGATTEVSVVLPDGSSGGNMGTCTGCAPSFAGMPGTLDINGLVSTAYVAVNPDPDAGTVGVNDAGALVDAYAGVALETFASANLSRAAPCDLTFDDLVELNSVTPPAAFGFPTRYDFRPSGDEMVAVVQGAIYSDAPNSYCETAFTMELYVSTTNLAEYGVRGYTVVHPDAGYPGEYCP